MSMLRGLRESTYRQLFDLESGSPTARRLDSFITWLIIVNLAANARDAMPEGGDLLLATENRSVMDGGRLREYVALTASDTGHGMSPEVQARMFDPYFTTKADGTGLGLAIVKKIVVEHGGAIEVRASERLGGAAFVIRLPSPSDVSPEAVRDARAKAREAGVREVGGA